jgi:N5-(cytidine 5'-diphosphoramidyl)-L-glutamine hydrolase
MTARRRIGIVQRQVTIVDRDEVRDALDVRLPALLWDEGFLPLALANRIADPAAYLDALALDGLVLSGGDDPGDTPERDAFETASLDHAEARRLPVLAICRGLQVLNLRAGGRLDPVDGHVATRHRVAGPLAPSGREVNSYHRVGVLPDGLGADLEVLASAADGCIEAFHHVRLPWTAIMWHPERESPTDPDDRALLRSVLAP